MSQEAEWGSPDKSRWQEFSEQSAREERRAAQTESSGGLCTQLRTLPKSQGKNNSKGL